MPTAYCSAPTSRQRRHLSHLLPLPGDRRRVLQLFDPAHPAAGPAGKSTASACPMTCCRRCIGPMRCGCFTSDDERRPPRAGNLYTYLRRQQDHKTISTGTLIASENRARQGPGAPGAHGRPGSRLDWRLLPPRSRGAGDTRPRCPTVRCRPRADQPRRAVRPGLSFYRRQIADRQRGAASRGGCDRSGGSPGATPPAGASHSTDRPASIRGAALHSQRQQIGLQLAALPDITPPRPPDRHLRRPAGPDYAKPTVRAPVPAKPARRPLRQRDPRLDNA